MYVYIHKLSFNQQNSSLRFQISKGDCSGRSRVHVGRTLTLSLIFFIYMQISAKNYANWLASGPPLGLAAPLGNPGSSTGSQKSLIMKNEE